MTILEEIIGQRKYEVSKLKKDVNIESLSKSPLFNRTPFSLKEALTAPSSSGIIAEFKRKSPSREEINMSVKVDAVTRGYLSAGAAAQSILTENSFFGGTMADLMEARTINTTHPILRKDFVVDGFQVVESKALGADVILLIAACLTSQQIRDYGGLAEDLGLEVLYEVHTQEDLDKIGLLDNKIIGINNRNLETFEVNLENSIALASQIPDSCIKVSESGINDPEVILNLKDHGFQGFLVGEHFMKASDPGAACKEFIDSVLNPH